MDIAAFIKELLTQLGILVVPGLGTFTRSREDGYYNKEQQQFYPPTLQIKFIPTQSDDNVLAERIAQERQISVASAKYFVEKFVNHVNDQAAAGTASFGEMGSFSTRRNILLFTNSNLNQTSELFYGLAPVKLKRNNSFKHLSLLPTPAKPVIPIATPEFVAVAAPVSVMQPVDDTIAPVTPVSPTVALPVTDPEDLEQYPEQDELPRRKANIWLVLAIIIIILGLTIFGVYLVKPNWFSQQDPYAKYLTNTPAFIPKAIKNDSVKKAAHPVKTPAVIKADSLANVKPIAVAVPVATPDTFRIVVSAVKTQKEGRIEVERFAKMGVEAKVHKAPARAVMLICVGNYLNNDSAKAALPVMRKKIKKPIRIQTFLSKK